MMNQRLGTDKDECFYIPICLIGAQEGPLNIVYTCLVDIKEVNVSSSSSLEPLLLQLCLDPDSHWTRPSIGL